MRDDKQNEQAIEVLWGIRDGIHRCRHERGTEGLSAELSVAEHRHSDNRHVVFATIQTKFQGLGSVSDILSLDDGTLDKFRSVNILSIRRAESGEFEGYRQFVGSFPVDGDIDDAKAAAEDLLAKVAGCVIKRQEDQTLQWVTFADDNDNTYYEALSPLHDDGSHFAWRLRQVLTGNIIRWEFAHDEELMTDEFRTCGPCALIDAKIMCQRAHDEIIESIRNEQGTM